MRARSKAQFERSYLQVVSQDGAQRGMRAAPALTVPLKVKTSGSIRFISG